MDGMEVKGTTIHQVDPVGVENRGRLISQIGSVELSPEVRRELMKDLDPQLISWRPVAKAKDGVDILAPYMRGSVVISQANRIFGVGNWALVSVGDYKVAGYANDGKDEYVSFSQSVALVLYGKLFSIRTGVMSAKLGLKGGLNSRADQIDKAVKGAETDAMKRAFRVLGKQFGSDLYKLSNRKASGGAPKSDQSGGAATDTSREPQRDNAAPRQRGNAPQPQQRGNAAQSQQRANAPQPQQRVNAPQPQRGNAPQPQRGNAPQPQRGNAPQPQQLGNAPQPQQPGDLAQRHPSNSQRGGLPQSPVNGSAGASDKSRLIRDFLDVACQMEGLGTERLARDDWFRRYNVQIEDSDERVIEEAIVWVRGYLAERSAEMGARR